MIEIYSRNLEKFSARNKALQSDQAKLSCHLLSQVTRQLFSAPEQRR